MECAGSVLGFAGADGPGWLRHRERTARRRAGTARSLAGVGRRRPSERDGLGILVSMPPAAGDGRMVLAGVLAAKRPHDRGGGPVDEQIKRGAPLIEALALARG